MPRNQFQRTVYAFLTVLVTVHCFVFYSLYVVNGATLRDLNGTTSVMYAINSQGGVYIFGGYHPIWFVVAVEFIFALFLELFMGGPCSFKLASRVFDPAKTHPVLFESAVICATAGLMCPVMSFIAAIIYFPYYGGFTITALLATWARLLCFNFPFALFSQMFFIQPLIRKIFKLIFRRNIEKREINRPSVPVIK